MDFVLGRMDEEKAGAAVKDQGPLLTLIQSDLAKVQQPEGTRDEIVVKLLDVREPVTAEEEPEEPAPYA